ncbi:MAG TPA: hypothetical protein VFW83_10890 [Bryobacteraceae bacterium]|nr:hypothetical protein [Bryobacteraceae bacterium]
MLKYVPAMLTIRPEQMRILNRAFEAAFRENVREYLQTYYASRCQAMGPEGLDSFIEKGIARAARYGIEIEADIFDFIEILFEYGLEFETQPALSWAAEILNDGASSGSARVDRLLTWLELFQDSQQAN